MGWKCLQVKKGEKTSQKNNPVLSKNYFLCENHWIILFTGKNPRPSDFTLVQLEPFKSVEAEHGWKSQVHETKGDSLTLDITPSSSCVIGEWSLSVTTVFSSSSLFCFLFPDDINILLNPWCKGTFSRQIARELHVLLTFYFERIILAKTDFSTLSELVYLVLIHRHNI